MGSDSDKECFDKSGPKHISEIDWGNEGHRRCITACLVRATYILESDRTKGRQDTPGARAPAWWRSFHLRLHRSPPVRHQPPAPPPHFIVAFRGTKLRVIPDIKDDISIILNLQDTCIRFRKAREHVAELLLEATGISGSGGVVWLAGHSLGASVALDVGRDLVIRRALNLPTFLFNPPHVSLAPVATALAAHVGGGQA
ncbi:GDSL esterase/lipase At4g10955-like [Setaria italica]|uniref:GDSL esterase/lipase At4g10955-like n=1 Tax=Setaria italica TaxID=4555 RepID=UPI000BE54B06|nr:GDSL esterase/lipase At4g10955-like [Setaria italica]